MKKRFPEEQIIGSLCEVEADVPVKELCRRHGFSDASYYLWCSRFGEMSVPNAKRLMELETGNAGGPPTGPGNATRFLGRNGCLRVE